MTAVFLSSGEGEAENRAFSEDDDSLARRAGVSKSIHG